MLELWEEATVREDDTNQAAEKTLISALGSNELSGGERLLLHLNRTY
jgi:hypothetical protein